MNKLILLFVFCFSFLSPFAQNENTVPNYKGFVNDFANVLTPEEVQGLNQFLLSYEDSTSTQIAVCIEKSLNGRDEFNRSLEIVRTWKVGQAGVNNGVLIYIAIEERKIFIQTADKTQGVLTDYETSFIIKNSISPEFKKGNYYQGISNGIVDIISVLGGEFNKSQKPSKGSIVPIIIFLVLIFIVVFIISRNNKNNGGGLSRRGFYPFPMGGGGGSWGGGSGGGGGSWGGFGGGGGFNGGGAGGGW